MVLENAICETTADCQQLAKEIVFAMLQSGVIKINPVNLEFGDNTEPSEMDYEPIYNRALYLHALIAKLSLAIQGEEDKFLERISSRQK